MQAAGPVIMPQELEQDAVAGTAPAAEPTAAAAGSGGGAPAEAEGAALPEMVLFRCKEAYVYRVPPATTVGHRAELWDVNKWLATVSLRVVQADDDASVRLLDEKTGDLFAECPVPTDKPLQTAVEPVIDSSRYFVLRIVDRDSGRHAFIGVGFRERSEASDFNAALHEFLQYIKRKRAAEAMRHAYEERLQSQASAGSESSEAASPLAPLPDLSIKEGETLRLRINAPKQAGSSNFVSGAGPRRGMLNKNFSLIVDGHGGTIAALSSPSPSSSPKLGMSLSPSLEAGGGSPSAA
ncbi:Adaptin ear-binding coat-associated 2 [Chlorella sorokiniana]|uniref:Adaptin ear-binding coat-associated 2 n=1 Tax=Chlorella sorokiniana TaxID=3076 RepID=A0A2P6TVR6_CHLSO|nr:Adaptin ear-binding coat-associated 2 [Chlorella sorokiniana]|eukprot:PRW58154.1 Adaptin ear-binding coat-associated 2 [Chlorella sorokiniana]